MKLSDPMIENVVTMLGHSQGGSVIAGMLGDMSLPAEYGLIAERCINYWRRHKQPPGPHLLDLFDDVFERPNDPRAPAVRFILSSMLSIKDGLNEEYVLARMNGFLRFNAISSGVLEVAAKLQHSDEQTLAEAEAMLAGLLRARQVRFDPGLSLSSVSEFIGHLGSSRGVELGIPPLDAVRVQPQKKTLFCKVGVTGKGKTWFLVHVGCSALRQRLKVLHITLEIDEPSVLGRYYQSLWSASEHAVRHQITELQQDAGGRILATTQTEQPPEFAFRDAEGLVNPELMREITSRIGHHGGLAQNLRIKAWPPRVATIDGIEAYLDTLSDAEHFEPDVVLVDYPQLMKASVNHFRLELGQNVEHLRRLGIERNAAMVMVHQGSRAGAKAKTLGMTHVAEDWSIVQTADFVVSYSATESEEKIGLARMHIDKARAPGAKGRTLILSQNYDIGQYALSAVLMPDNYLDYMEQRQPSGVIEEDEPEGEGNEDEGTLFR